MTKPILRPRADTKVFICGGGYQYIDLFYRLGFSGCRTVEDADIVVFTGGEDVTPELYGEVAMAQTHYSRERDVYEQDVYRRASERELPMIGICRGGQFLNVMNKGKLWQHVAGHACGEHVAYDCISKLVDGKRREINVTSTHHQMMIPGPGALLLLSATKATEKHSPETLVTGIDRENEDVEVLVYPETACLCFQPHPEFPNAPADLVDFFEECVLDWIEPMIPAEKGKSIINVIPPAIKKDK